MSHSSRREFRVQNVPVYRALTRQASSRTPSLPAFPSEGRLAAGPLDGDFQSPVPQCGMAHVLVIEEESSSLRLLRFFAAKASPPSGGEGFVLLFVGKALRLRL